MKILKLFVAMAFMTLGMTAFHSPVQAQISCEDLPDGCPDDPAE